MYSLGHESWTTYPHHSISQRSSTFHLTDAGTVLKPPKDLIPVTIYKMSTTKIHATSMITTAVLPIQLENNYINFLEFLANQKTWEQNLCSHWESVPENEIQLYFLQNDDAIHIAAIGQYVTYGGTFFSHLQ